MISKLLPAELFSNARGDVVDMALAAAGGEAHDETPLPMGDMDSHPDMAMGMDMDTDTGAAEPAQEGAGADEQAGDGEESEYESVCQGRWAALSVSVEQGKL
jgi:hypothetical protein